MQRQKLILATANAHKVAEFETLLAGLNLEICSAAICGGMPPVEETEATFEGNARLKAEALRARAPKDAWVLADDSGLEVDALDGAPGVYSARYAGPGADDAANVARLLRELQAVGGESSAARFRCVLCLIDSSGRTTFHAGSCEGRIAPAPAGTSGFGYDPVFIPEGYRQSFAELGEAVKSQLSHRARAVAVLRAAFER